MRWLAGLGFILIASTASATDLKAPLGWRFPTDNDSKGKWIEYRDDFPVPYRAVADFDGNGQLDEAWILLREKGEGFALYVFMRDKKGTPRAQRIFSYNECCGQNYAVGVVKPGKILTQCGRFPEDCSPSDPKSVTLSHPGFDFLTLGTASGLYYWNSKSRRFDSVTDAD